MSNFVDNLKTATDEVSQVQPLYRKELFDAIKDAETVYVEGDFSTRGNLVARPVLRMAKVKDPYTGVTRDAKVEDVEVKGTDGIFHMEYLKLDNAVKGMYVGFMTLLECKLDQDFSDKVFRAKVILQVICYLKQIQLQEGRMPDITLIGSKKNCFLLRSNLVEKYVARDIKNYTAASTADMYNHDIVAELMQDEDLTASCFIHTIDNDFSMGTIVKDIYTYISGNDTNRKLSDAEIAKAFDIFTMQVLQKASKINPRDQVKYFLSILLNPDTVYMHPKKANTLIIGDDSVSVNADNYASFKEQYGMEKTYTLEEQRNFTAQADRLIEEADRRRRGDFYTPTLWVDEAHKLISKNLGSNWRNEYMVWDCAWGTGNLTRDYKFKDLYCSTLVESDLTLGAKYNVDAVKFQYDFLNDDVEKFEELARIKELKGGITLDDILALDLKLYREAPSLINGLLSGKKLLFFINPPYGTANTLTGIATQSKEYKNGVARTTCNILMKQQGIGVAAQQLYAQFIWRMNQIKRALGISVDFAIFAPALYITGGSFKKFRHEILSCYKNSAGFVFKASDFADVNGNWGITFSLWLGNNEKADVVSCDMQVALASGKGVKYVGQKRFYNLDKVCACADWCKTDEELVLLPDFVPLTSALVWLEENKCGSFARGSLGYYYNVSNIVDNNSQLVFMLSSANANGHGYQVMPDNFRRVCVTFTARRLITGEYANWINWQDEYMIPNTAHPEYARFEADALVFSLFDSKSNQSSMRNIPYNGKTWDIKNEFFWLSRAEMLELAQGKLNPADINNDIERDIMMFGEDERFMYKQLQEAPLSLWGRAVLDKATDLLKKSFKYRQAIACLHPEYHLNTWDMGYYQLNKMIKEIPELQTEWKEFRDLFKEFADGLRPLVYELGFLYK